MIYFMQDSGSLNVKIGFTASQDALAAEVRRKALQTGNPSRLVVLAAMPGTEQDEAKLHQRFDAHCVGGEWFRPVPEVLALIGDARAAKPAETHLQPLRIYLAGKMGGASRRDTPQTWRETILSEGARDCDDVLFLHGLPAEWERLPVSENAVLDAHDYVGPCHFDCLDGHLHDYDNRHGFVSSLSHTDDEERDRVAVRCLCLDAIRRADVVFCWLDSTDCHGTLAEIGYAHALGRRIWAAGPQPLPDLWFAVGMAEWQLFTAASPKAALQQALRWSFRVRYLPDLVGEEVPQ